MTAYVPHALRYPSYVEDIMGDIFSLGFGPFRWVSCLEMSDMLVISRDPDGIFAVGSEKLMWQLTGVV